MNHSKQSIFGARYRPIWAMTWFMIVSLGADQALAQAAADTQANPSTKAPVKAPIKAGVAASSGGSKTVKPVVASPSAPAAKPVAKVAPKPGSSRVEAHSKAEQMAAGVRAAEAALTPEQLEIAQLVYTGHLPCELGASVQLEADPQSPGYFNLRLLKQRFRMVPVATTTGAVRLEDERSGSVWLQLANKSMLMNQKQGKRVADECQSPQQLAVAQSYKDAPPASILEAAPSTAPNAPVTAMPSAQGSLAGGPSASQ